MSNEHVCKYIIQAYGNNNFIKNYNTVYAICDAVNKDIYGVTKSYVLRDYNNNVITVEREKLLRALLLNQIDVVGLSVSEDYKILQKNVITANSIEEIDSILADKTRYTGYIGNNHIGYFYLDCGSLVDYLGVCETVVLPKNIRGINEQLFAFNTYVKNVVMPTNDYVYLGFGIGACNLKHIEVIPDNNIRKLIDLRVRTYNSYDYQSSCEQYLNVSNRTDVELKIRDLVGPIGSIINIFKRTDIPSNYMLLNNNEQNIEDALDKYMIKDMLIHGPFKIEYKKRKLVGMNISKHIKQCKLPPVDKLGIDWWDECTFGTIILPETLIQYELDHNFIPTKVERIGNDLKFRRLVDRVIIPKSALVKFVLGEAANVGIIYETRYGTGTADEIVVNMPKSGIEIKIINIMEYQNQRRVVIEDINGKRMVTLEEDIIENVDRGMCHLTNADILFNRTIRIRDIN